MPTPSIVLTYKHAPKVGKYATGKIGYQLLCDDLRQNTWFRIVSNDSSGWFSRELIHADNIFECIKHLGRADIIPSKSLASAFKSRSANNAGFLAAALRSEGLVAPAPDSASRHILGEDWEVWKCKIMEMKGTPLTENDHPEEQAWVDNPATRPPKISNRKSKTKPNPETDVDDQEP
jgi:hypothetical protein